MRYREDVLTSITFFMPSTVRICIFSVLGARIGKKAFLGLGSFISKGVVIGERVHVGRNAKIYTRAILGNDVSIGSDTVLKNVTFGERCTIGKWCLIANSSIGSDSHIESRVTFTGYRDGSITIGEHCYIGISAVLDWSSNIIIGDNVHIAGPSASLWTHSSVYQAMNMLPLANNDFKISAPVSIGSCTWIGGGVVIYPGVSVGHHSVVLPNSVVRNDVSDYSFAGGNPCRELKKVVNDCHSTFGYRFD